MADKSTNTVLKRHCRVVALLAAAAVVLGLATGAAKRDANTPLVWPSPPAEPRISFVQTIASPGDLGKKPSGWSRFKSWIIGTHEGTERVMKPFGVALDENDNLCFTDTGANAVCFFDVAKKDWHRWDKVGNVRFASPVSVAKKGDTLYVADSALQSVVIFNTKGKLLHVFTNGLDRPAGLTLMQDKLYVVDSQQSAVLIYSLDGKPLGRFGKRGGALGEFNFPTHIASDRKDTLFVTDSLNSRVQLFDARGECKGRIGSQGDTPGHFGRPKGVASDSYGRVYVVDALYDNLQIFERDGRFLLSLGEAGGERGEFWLPNGIAIARDNRIYIADSYNRRIQVLKYIGGQ